jgi:DNA-binding transcriptional LysR family regulator
MSESSQTPHPDFQGLPSITFRQLEVFCIVCREGSYANAALELRSTRTNIKRVCEDFEKAVGRQLFTEGPDRMLLPTPFAKELLGQTSALSRGLHRLGESVRSLHEKGRILRFAAAGEFFRGGLFTDFLTRLKISESFRPCFMRIESDRFRQALLGAECDVYFGAGITASDRLEIVHLGPIPWKFQSGPTYSSSQPSVPADLVPGKWRVAEAGDPEAGALVLAAIHSAGALDGRMLGDDTATDDEIVLRHDTSRAHSMRDDQNWPHYQFSAVLKKHHPYSELMARLMAAASH